MQAPPYSITLAILAGGKGSRMNGRFKALIPLGNSTLIEQVYNNLAPLFQQTIILINKNVALPVNATPHPDLFSDKGPVGGIHSALTHAQTRRIFVVPVDMPFASAEIAERLIHFNRQNPDYSIVVPAINGNPEPLFGLYSRAILPKLESILSSSRCPAVRGLTGFFDSYLMELPLNRNIQRAFHNINTPEALSEAHKLLAPKPR